MIQRTFSNHNVSKLEINNKRIFESPKPLEIKSVLKENLWVKDDITKKLRTYFKLNKNKTQHKQNTINNVYRRQFIAVNINTKTNFSSQRLPEELEKQKQGKPKASRRNNISKNQTEKMSKISKSLKKENTNYPIQQQKEGHHYLTLRDAKMVIKKYMNQYQHIQSTMIKMDKLLDKTPR